MAPTASKMASSFLDDDLLFAMDDPAPEPSFESPSDPLRPRRKRVRIDNDDSADDERSGAEETSFASFAPYNRSRRYPTPPSTQVPTTNESNSDINLVVYGRTLARQLNLNPPDVQNVERFALEQPAAMLVHIYTVLLDHSAQLARLRSNAEGSFIVTPELILNIKQYAAAVLLSPRLQSYRSEHGPSNHVLAIVRTLRANFGLPENIEDIPADWRKIVDIVRRECTQARSAIKKAIKNSISAEDSANHTNIFQLTERLVTKANVTLTLPGLARAALIRRVYTSHGPDNFWSAVDDALASVRRQADGNHERAIRGFRFILEEDIKTHGKVGIASLHNSKLPALDVIDARQQAVANAIEEAPAVPAPGLHDGSSDDDEHDDGEAGKGSGSGKGGESSRVSEATDLAA